jgi:hypothetical protein
MAIQENNNASEKVNQRNINSHAEEYKTTRVKKIKLIRRYERAIRKDPQQKRERKAIILNKEDNFIKE